MQRLRPPQEARAGRFLGLSRSTNPGAYKTPDRLFGLFARGPRFLALLALTTLASLGLAGAGCDEATKTCFPVTCPDDSVRRVCDPPSCADTGSCDGAATCAQAESGELVCIPGDICN